MNSGKVTTASAQRRKLRKDNRSGYRGVSLDRGRFRVHLSIGKKPVHIGLFGSAIEAAKAYDRAALEFYGEDASLNFPVKK